ncbi:fructose-bisphosphatase class III [Lacticaseibacillus paracasei]|uniref:fructose-bisphosphatase class III n=2 Tax=Lacticaseibacillus paracasei TaxID=1597 RepID=UPI000BDF24A6|nr:fructose-bisphosphatase class III [Lacticaseibacillus paracasei]MBU6045958.1 fructose-bisphosphatase class III [Lacticaseibacillus paracasei]MBU6047268.1 fructose-bisphosphatase class III [Lacticaseibacillus paracasei]MCL4970786.1 fructose-bisphosphatase class III [Lacticaseibacillus paracasei]MCL4972056.1 fructose-bisphosphatase class III [Lacticaseibacillus paracasei]QHC81103.1 fructose-bisphosphatase class III [Lacticaseibacillus paracasei]
MLCKHHFSKNGQVFFHIFWVVTLIMQSRHQPFTTKADAIANLTDIISTRRVVETEARRRTVAETDIGTELQDEVEVLKRRLGELREED